MQTWHSESDFKPTDPTIKELFNEQSIFFDIETTGFSSKHAICYLIGCATLHDDKIHIDQFFAEKIIDEEEVLTAFLNFLSGYKTIISFNGLGFDIPFLKGRCSMLGIEEQFDSFLYTDLFKSISKLKNILKLTNYKQKSLEQFLGIDRVDKYSGGDLINVYFDYQKHPCHESLNLLKTHNFEDVTGMISLLPVLSYSHFFAGHFVVASLEKNEYHEYDGDTRQEMLITLKSEYLFPKRVSYGFDDIYFTAFGNIGKLSIKIYNGELKYFYKNYKDYYYLPNEDMAVHKSVAFYVDKDYRTKAKAATCYSKRTGCFLPQYEEVISPYFKLEYHDSKSFFECTSDFYQSDENLKKYCSHLLSLLLQHK